MRVPKEALYAGAAVICVAAAGLFYTADRRKQADIYVMAAAEDAPAAVAAAEADEPPPTEAAVKKIKVYIAGAVKNPGVYELVEGGRVEDALALAGGPAEDANMLGVNLAARLKDEQQIIVPKEGEVVDKPIQDGQNNDSGGLININTADESKLMELPGVGQATAKNIISYREEHGGFKSIEDIKNVNRIGEKTFERLKELITAG